MGQIARNLNRTAVSEPGQDLRPARVPRGDRWVESDLFSM